MEDRSSDSRRRVEVRSDIGIFLFVNMTAQKRNLPDTIQQAWRDRRQLLATFLYGSNGNNGCIVFQPERKTVWLEAVLVAPTEGEKR